MSRRIKKPDLAAIAGITVLSLAASAAFANEDLVRLSQSDENWVMQCKDYPGTHYSKMTDVNADNVARLRPTWSFSTGVLHGHEGSPLVVNGIM